MLRYFIAFIVSLGVSSLLFSIEWFTWQAWLFVALYLLIQYRYQMCRSEDSRKIALTITDNIKSVGVDLDKTQQSVKRINESVDNMGGVVLEKYDKMQKAIDYILKVLIHEA